MASALRTSFRNLWRHRRRTLVNLSAVGLGLSLVVLYIGIVDATLADAETAVDRIGSGHVQISAAGYRLERDVGLTLPDPTGTLSRLELPEGAKASQRVVAPALLSSAWGSRGVELLGVDPEREGGVSEPFRNVRKGSALAPEDRRGILLGPKLAEKLRVDVGGKVKVTVQRPDGEIGADLFRVRGILGGGSMTAASGMAFVTMGAARALLGLGEVAHVLVVMLPDARKGAPDRLAARLRERLGPAVEVAPLSEMVPILKKYADLVDVFVLVLLLVIYTLVGLGVLNTMLMSILERTHELGVLMALGTRPARIVREVLGEGAWIATLGALGGFALGLLFTWLGQDGVVDYRKEFGEVYEWDGVAMSMLMKTQVSVARAAVASGIVWVLTFLSSLYPAWRVTRLRPAEALRKS